MAYSLRIGTLLLILGLGGCGDRTALPLYDDGGAGGMDATPDDAGPDDAGLDDAGPDDAGPDAGPDDAGPDDAGPDDAGPDDAGPDDAGTPALARELSCRMDAERALDAVVRHVACRPDSRATVPGLLEAWEAGLFGSFERFIEITAGYRFQFGCEAWRCIAGASSCAEHDVCLEGVRRGGCDEVASRCDGSVLERCLGDDGGEGLVRLFDCASVGARCEEGACVVDGCRFGRRSDELGCDGSAVSLCDGAVRIPCDAWRPGTTCASFAIGGEIPTRTCMPSGFGGAGAYPTEGECDDGTLRFDTVGGRDVEVDCLARGYSACAGRGCVP